jgi:hypothetical protein
MYEKMRGTNNQAIDLFLQVLPSGDSNFRPAASIRLYRELVRG